MRKVVLCVLLGALFFIPAFFSGYAAAAPEVTLRFAGQFLRAYRYHPHAAGSGGSAGKNGGTRGDPGLSRHELGDYTLVYEELIRGSIDMAAITVPSQFDPRLEIAYINCIVRTFDGARRLLPLTDGFFTRWTSFIPALG